MPEASERNHASAAGRLRRWFAVLGPSAAGYESSRRLVRWLLVGSAIGVVAGAGAVLFTWAIHAVTVLGLGTFAGYAPPEPVGESTRA